MYTLYAVVSSAINQLYLEDSVAVLFLATRGQAAIALQLLLVKASVLEWLLLWEAYVEY